MGNSVPKTLRQKICFSSVHLLLKIIFCKNNQQPVGYLEQEPHILSYLDCSSLDLIHLMLFNIHLRQCNFKQQALEKTIFRGICFYRFKHQKHEANGYCDAVWNKRCITSWQRQVFISWWCDIRHSMWLEGNPPVEDDIIGNAEQIQLTWPEARSCTALASIFVSWICKELQIICLC